MIWASSKKNSTSGKSGSGVGCPWVWERTKTTLIIWKMLNQRTQCMEAQTWMNNLSNKKQPYFLTDTLKNTTPIPYSLSTSIPSPMTVLLSLEIQITHCGVCGWRYGGEKSKIDICDGWSTVVGGCKLSDCNTEIMKKGCQSYSENNSSTIKLVIRSVLERECNLG